MLHKPVVRKMARISPVWIVPIVALTIAVWLAVQAQLEKGTQVEITFTNASDIIPGQTQIRLKDVKIGMVKSLKLSEDLSSVVVTADLDREVSRHLSKNTRFWVVTPRISATGVSNLGTLISGVYIVMDPGEQGGTANKFVGLDQSPAVRSDETGSHYVLQSENLGSMDVGSPIYYRKIKVGEVTGYKLADNHQHVDINFFIRSPHDVMVKQRSRFWNVSGFGLTVGAEGMKAEMGSIASIIAGGVEFDNSASIGLNELAELGHRFYLYPDRDSVLEERFTIKHYYLLRFSGSVRGLAVGAPVEFKGIKVGEVVDVALVSSDNIGKSLHVYIAMEPQRFDAEISPSRDEADARIELMVGQGLRAQMNTASLITGSKFIDLVFMDDALPGEFIKTKNYTELPTADDSVSLITEKLDTILAEVATIPLGEIGNDLAASMASLKSILGTLEQQNTALKIDGAMAGLDDTMGAASMTLAEAQTMLQNINYLVAPDSAVSHELSEMLKSLSEAGETLERFLDELNRHPNALISGAKKND